RRYTRCSGRGLLFSSGHGVRSASSAATSLPPTDRLGRGGESRLRFDDRQAPIRLPRGARRTPGSSRLRGEHRAAHPAPRATTRSRGAARAAKHRDVGHSWLAGVGQFSRVPKNFYVIVIDEINRGDPARIFGELLYALEYRGAAVDLPTGGQLNIPPNLIVIGTMNSVDRSVALVDYALRRRFGFIRVEPDVEVVRKVHKGKSGAGVAAEVLTALNAWLSEQLDPDHQIGHSYFLGADLRSERASCRERA